MPLKTAVYGSSLIWIGLSAIGCIQPIVPPTLPLESTHI